MALAVRVGPVVAGGAIVMTGATSSATSAVQSASGAEFEASPMVITGITSGFSKND